jgi:hypothetical protein
MREKGVTVRLRGGLGNQLFQYAAGLAKSRELKTGLTIDARQLPGIGRVTKGVSHWPEQISEFRNGASGILRSDGINMGLARLLQIERAVGDLYPNALAKLGRYANEINPSIDAFRSIAARQVTVNAYCNSPSYFLGSQDEIRQRIADLVNPSDDYLKASELVKLEAPLGIHVRLGDYKNLKSIYGGVDSSYFANALGLAEKVGGKREIWLFSDEPDLALSMLGKAIKDLRVAPVSKELSGLESLLVMSKCRGIVASNSTFSWWAAYLMEQAQPIIFPRPFFAATSLSEPKSMLLNNWIQIGRSVENV